MPKTEVISNSYITLLKDLKSLLIEGLLKAQAAVEKQTVITHWQAGELIFKHILENKRADYGSSIMMNLAKDLNTQKTKLDRMVKFYRLFSLDDLKKELEWTHYSNLISVDDKAKRNFFLKQATRQNWNSKDLRRAIRIYKIQLKSLRKEPQEPVKAPKLSVTRGKLYTYKLIRPKSIVPVQNELIVDCGFHFQRDVGLTGLSKPEEEDIVESVKTASDYRLKASGATSKDIYTHKAFVEEVVDGDTIWANIDLGFRSWYRINLRFRGIDAPEMSTKKGVRAKEFVESVLSKVPFIIIRSTELGKYGRPISDIFYLENEYDPHVVAENGTFLNQQLLDLGLAKIMEG